MDHTNQGRRITIVEQPMSLFRIIPDRSVSNHQNRRVWRLLHDLMAMDHSFRSRFSRHKGWRFNYQLRDQVWFEVVFTCKEKEIVTDDTEEKREYDYPLLELERTANFYICVPTKYAETFCHKLQDKNTQLTFEEVPLNSIVVSPLAEIAEYRLQRHDVFSLRSNDNEQTSPISSFLNTAYDLQGNDMVRLSFCLERMERKKWRSLAEYAWNQLDKKRIPVRARFDAALLSRNFGDMSRYLVGEIRSIAEDIMQGFQNVFMKSDHTFKREKNSYENSEFNRMMVNGQLSVDTKKKVYEPTFKTKIRLAIQSEDRSRLHMIGHSISNALSELSEDNALLPHKVTVHIKAKIIDEMNSFQPKIKDRDTNVLSAKEIGKLHQYPTRDLQAKYPDILTFKPKVEIDVPKIFRDPAGIHLGISEFRGEKVGIYLPVPKFNDKAKMDEFMMSRVFMGSPRMGKDTMIANFIVGAVEKGCSALILDVVCEEGNTRGLADSIRDALPVHQVIDLDLEQNDFSVYLGLSEIMEKSDDVGNLLANEFAELFELDDKEQTLMYLREGVKACNGDLFALRLMLMSSGSAGGYLDLKIKELTAEGKEYEAAFWDSYRNETDGMRSYIRKPILNRLATLFSDNRLKNMFAQKPNPEINFAHWFKEGKAIIIRVPNRPPFSSSTVKTICQWMVMKAFLTKQTMQDKECPTFLVLNEPHQFLNDKLEGWLNRMLVECPKLRLSLIFAFHHLGQIPDKLRDTLISSSMNWHLFKNTHLKTYESMAPYLLPTYTPEEAMLQTEQYDCINILFRGGTYVQPWMMRALAPVNSRKTPFNNKHLTAMYTEQYGQPRKEVEAEIFQREKILFTRK